MALHKRLSSPLLRKIEAIGTFQPLKPLHIGEIAITPIPTDHSAYDASMFLIETEGKRILHTGDFRLHGFRGTMTQACVQRHAGNIDLLILEGTLLNRPDGTVQSEYELQEKLREIIARNKYVFALCSSTNIDRMAMLHNATPRGRCFVCDDYQLDVFRIVSRETKSKYYRFQKALFPGPNLALRDRGFVLPVRNNAFFRKIIREYAGEENAVLIYSMWDGYLDGRNPGLNDFVSPFREAGRMIPLHTSGHATSAAITELCRQTSASAILPIHTKAPEAVRTLLPDTKVILLRDGDRYALD